MKKLLIGLVAVFTLSACSQTNSPDLLDENLDLDSVEVEDCDFDDLLEGDEDCYGVDLEDEFKKSSKVKKAKDKATKAKADANKKIKSTKTKVNKAKSTFKYSPTKSTTTKRR